MHIGNTGLALTSRVYFKKHRYMGATIFYIIILIIGSITLSKKIKELSTSVKTKNKSKIKVDIFFLSLTVALIVLLIVFNKTSFS